MPKTIQLTHEYDAPARELFRVATDFDCFVEAMKNVATFEGLPDEPLHEGMVINAKVSLFGKLPPMDHTMEVREYNEEAMRVKSHEYGGAIKAWDHTIQVSGDENHSRITDTITLDAGWLTPIYALWARYVYSARHKPRLKMLGLN